MEENKPITNENNRPIKPDSNLVWGILTTIFCCLPFGIVSIVYAAQVDSEWTQGLYEEARRSARKARNWALASAISGAIIVLLYLLVALAWFGSIAYFITSETNYQTL